MTLGFSTIWPEKMGDLAGKPTYFPQKIIKGVPLDKWSKAACMGYFGSDKIAPYYPWYEWENLTPKLHTIRHDPHDRWKPGVKIHMVIYNRTKNRFQFVPMMKCVDTQEIKIRWFEDYPQVHGASPKINGRYVSVRIDKKPTGSGMEPYRDWLLRLAQNDGFDSVVHFFRWFNQDTKPNTKIIHWTNLKY